MIYKNLVVTATFTIVTLITLTSFVPEPTKSIISNTSSYSVEYIMGKFDPAAHPDFMEIPVKWADQKGRYLRKDAFDCFVEMATAAQKAGHYLIIKSATRNFENQKTIWEKKWNGTTILEDNTKASNITDPVKRAKKILLYSSMPGTSRHHWGTDIDINAFINEYFENGKGKELYEWMQAHAHEYGFCQVYNSKSVRANGYNEEKWHWSYMPVASKILDLAKSQLNNKMISGFKGAETATTIDMVNNYILSINVKCKE
jgi:zinc D-Ala-D-Ala carboxypeptidase